MVRMLDLWSRDHWFDSRSGRYHVVTTKMGDCLWTGKPSRYITYTRVSSFFHPCVVPCGRWCSSFEVGSHDDLYTPFNIFVTFYIWSEIALGYYCPIFKLENLVNNNPWTSVHFDDISHGWAISVSWLTWSWRVEAVKMLHSHKKTLHRIYGEVEMQNVANDNSEWNSR